MPSAKTWWWIGIGTGIAALGTAGVIMIWRGRQVPVVLPPTDLGGVGSPPPVPPPSPTPPDEIVVVIPAVPYEFREEICRQWKIGSYRPDWRPDLFDVLMSQIDAQIEARDNSWQNEAERQRKAFLIARGVLKSLCPEIPRPKSQAEADELRTRHFYWKELWDRIYPAAYNKIKDAYYTGFSPS